MSSPRAPRRLRISTAALAGTTALSMLALAGCGSDDGAGAGSGDGRLAVTASLYPMAFLAERIGGDHVEVTTLTSPGTDPHDLELSPRQVGELSQADVIAYIAGLQPAVDDAIGQSGVDHVVEALELVNAEPPAEGHDHGDDEDDEDDDHRDEGLGGGASTEATHADHGHDHAEDDDHDHGDDHAEDDADGHADDDDHDHGEDDHDGHHHGHDHGDGDPHLWLDPLTYAVAAEGMADALSEADPDNAADYRKNTDELTAELRTLDEEFDEGLANREIDTIITTHAAFGFLAERYGLHEESIAGLDPESEPSGARMRELHQIAEREGVTTVFFEVLASDSMAQTLADDLGLRTDVLDPVEGITEDSRGADYFEVMRANLTALQEALGGRP